MVVTRGAFDPRGRKYPPAGCRDVFQCIVGLDLLTAESASSLMIRTWNGAHGFGAFMSGRSPGRFTNSAPEIPSSEKMQSSASAQSFRSA